jgi:hypothetical protein
MQFDWRAQNDWFQDLVILAADNGLVSPRIGVKTGCATQTTQVQGLASEPLQCSTIDGTFQVSRNQKVKLLVASHGTIGEDA